VTKIPGIDLVVVAISRGWEKNVTPRRRDHLFGIERKNLIKQLRAWVACAAVNSTHRAL